MQNDDTNSNLTTGFGFGQSINPSSQGQFQAAQGNQGTQGNQATPPQVTPVSPGPVAPAPSTSVANAGPFGPSQAAPIDTSVYNPQAPLAGMSGAGTAGTPVPPPPPPPPAGDPNYVFGQAMKDFVPSLKIPPHSLNFDEIKFLKLLAGSISLTKDEKKKIVESVPTLRQQQVDELIRIFTEEQEKFRELSKEHGLQLKKLEDQHWAEWMDLETVQKAESQKAEDTNKAEEIRKQLGI